MSETPRLGMHPGEGFTSRRDPRVTARREPEGLAGRASNRAEGGVWVLASHGSSLFERPRDRSNRTRPDVSGGNEGSPAARRGDIDTVSSFPPCLR
jgi:hypothetical protein